MFKETLKTKFSREVKRSYMSSLSTSNLLTLIGKMKHKPTLDNGHLHSMVLLNRPEKQIVLTTFDKGAEINSFQSKELMVLQVIWGKLNFYTHEKSLTLSQGELFSLDEKEPFKLTTDEETVFLLTLISGSLGQTTINFADNEVL